MASTRIAAQAIESWTPAIDARSIENGSLFVLSGKNFVFDAKGPQSGFGSTLVTKTVLDSSSDFAQSIEIAGRTLVFVGTGVYELRDVIWDGESDDFTLDERYWFRIAEFVPQPDSEVGQYLWTAAYVGFGSYVSHPNYGIFKLTGDTLTPFTPVGLEGVIVGIAETAGRLIIQTDRLTQYSNADAADDLTPELGGAGFQVTAQRCPGNPLALTSFQGGFIVWTDSGVMVAEFIGGEAVFRFDRVVTEQFLLAPRSWTSLASGEVIVVTAQGLYRSSPSSGLSSYNDLFNEYLRELIRQSDDIVIRLNYFKHTNQLFAQVMDTSSDYIRTFVYHQAAEKWGEFSEPHRGIIRFGSDSDEIGYMDLDGYVHHFDGSTFIENPDGTTRGLDSFVEIGHLSPSQGGEHADMNFEMQEIVISNLGSMPATANLTEENWGGPASFVSFNIGFYLFDEDWNQFGLDYYDVDFNEPGPDEDWNESGEDDDYNETVAGQRDFDWNDSDYIDDDWNLTPDGGVDTEYIEHWGYVSTQWDSWENWTHQLAFLNSLDYQLEVRCNLDSWEDELTVTPTKALAQAKMDMWTLFSHGHSQRLYVFANQPGEKFHVTALSFSVTYAGQIS